MDEAQELNGIAKAHAADVDLLRTVRGNRDPGAVVASLLRATAAHAALHSAGGGPEEAHLSSTTGQALGAAS